MNLEKTFVKYKCDKAKHGYHKFYERILNDKIGTILEIGVKNGRSLASWKEALPSAKLFGIDITDREFNADLIPKDAKTFICDSTSKESLNIIGQNKFDVIIDDGSHFVEDQIMTFENFRESFTRHYVIEDIFGENLDYLVGYIRTYKDFQNIEIFLSKQNIPMSEYKKFLETKGRTIKIKPRQEGFNLNMYAIIISK
jgi:hypothetical protein